MGPKQGYTLHGGHALSSSVMALSLMLCTVPLSIYEAASLGRPIDLVTRVVGALLLVPATILLAVRPCRVGGYGTQSLWLVRVTPPQKVARLWHACESPQAGRRAPRPCARLPLHQPPAHGQLAPTAR
jgi:hypothetical protein